MTFSWAKPESKAGSSIIGRVLVVGAGAGLTGRVSDSEGTPGGQDGELDHDHGGHTHDHADHGHGNTREHGGHADEPGGHADEHGHGHHNDQGLSGALRYLRFAPQMWRSDINDAVVELVGPTGDDVVVDIGAGMGAGTAVAVRSGARVVAVEPTPFLRRVLGLRRTLLVGRERVNVVDGSAEKLPVDDGEATAVMAVNTMHHWIDVERAVAEIARVLGPGGRVVLVDEDFDDPAHPEHERFASRNAAGSSESNGDDDGHHHHGFTMVDGDRLAKLLTAGGLHRVEARTAILANRPVIALTANKPAS